ncbi:MAG: ribosomal protein S18-alanine N-acetyltransferase [Syntrophobacteraceae bacterium]
MEHDIAVSASVKFDLPSILQIEQDSQPEPWTQKSFLEEIGRGSLFVARDAFRDVAGYICFWSVSDEIQILNVAVRAQMRRRGIAGKLVAFALRAGRLSRAKIAVLEVRKGNLGARRLYESLGFKITGERPGYYGKRSESAILMERLIETE